MTDGGEERIACSKSPLKDKMNSELCRADSNDLSKRHGSGAILFDFEDRMFLIQRMRGDGEADSMGGGLPINADRRESKTGSIDDC